MQAEEQQSDRASPGTDIQWFHGQGPCSRSQGQHLGPRLMFTPGSSKQLSLNMFAGGKCRCPIGVRFLWRMASLQVILADQTPLNLHFERRSLEERSDPTGLGVCYRRRVKAIEIAIFWHICHSTRFAASKLKIKVIARFEELTKPSDL